MKKKDYCKPEAVCVEILSEQMVFAFSTQQLSDFEYQEDVWE